MNSVALIRGRTRWWAFFAVCLGNLLIVIEQMVVVIALRSIQSELGFSELSLSWVVNAYLITYSGCLLIGGRLGDLLGPRKLFLIGIALFTAASAACGLASSPVWLIGARAAQGLGGAVVTPVALSLTLNLFPKESERATAIGVFNCINASGSSVGMLLGATLTSLVNWHWIFLINLPLGAAAYMLCVSCVPDSPRHIRTNALDIAGAASITASLTLAVYGIVDANRVGWNSPQTVILLTGAGAALLLFLFIELRAPSPIMPLRLFRQRNLVVVTVVFMLWAAASYSWYFVSALYLQTILNYSAEQAGLTFLPFTLVIAALALSLSSKRMMRFGNKRLLIAGLLMATTGVASFARTPVQGELVTDILPGMFLAGLGAGMLCVQTFRIATKGVTPAESGLISGIVTTANLMGAALGLATLVGAGSVYTDRLLAGGVSLPMALNGGYHVVFCLAAGLMAIASLIGAALLQAEED